MLKLLRPTLPPEKHTATIDVIFAILLLVATLSTAVCVYQATRWNGVQATDFGESAQFRAESIKASSMANSLELVDIEVFLDWVNAASTGDLRQKTFLEERFRAEFRPAFEAWKAEANLTTPIPPGTPFSRPEVLPGEKSGERPPGGPGNGRIRPREGCERVRRPVYLHDDPLRHRALLLRNLQPVGGGCIYDRRSWW